MVEVTLALYTNRRVYVSTTGFLMLFSMVQLTATGFEGQIAPTQYVRNFLLLRIEHVQYVVVEIASSSTLCFKFSLPSK